MLDPKERNYIDNIWANNRNPTFPKVLTSFSDYLHQKNLKQQLSDPVLKPRSLDAFLELQQTNQILAGEVAELQQQLKQVKKDYEKEKREKELLKIEWEKDIKDKEKTFEKFPAKLSPLQQEIMGIIFNEKHQQLVDTVNLLAQMATSSTFQPSGISFYLTRFRGHHSYSKVCFCTEDSP